LQCVTRRGKLSGNASVCIDAAVVLEVIVIVVLSAYFFIFWGVRLIVIHLPDTKINNESVHFYIGMIPSISSLRTAPYSINKYLQALI
jgi:hypothetical protein